MKWLNLDYIKQHSRICCDCEDALLELYARSAEDFVLSYCNTTYEDIIEKYGEIPAPLYEAALLVVNHSYTQRDIVTPQNMSVVPYGFEAKTKPYWIL